MSAIIYEQTPGGLYPTGQRTVTTFPSGLIRVDQAFSCKTSAAATHRATLAVGEDFPGDSYPAMDGLKIFPEPQEKRRDDGFTEFSVTSFGRVNDVGTSTDSFEYSGDGATRIKTKTSLKQYVDLNNDQSDSILFPSSTPVISVSRETTKTKVNLLFKYWDWVGYFRGSATESVTPSDFRLSFWGSGTVILSGQHTATVNGVGNNTKSYSFNIASAGNLTIQPSGTVRNASLVYIGSDSDTIEWQDLISTGWYLKSISSSNFGSFKEVSLLFNAK
jgi:hypothetical protein